MAKFKRSEVVQIMTNSGFTPVFYHSDIEIAKNVLKACYEGGARVFEFTNRDAWAHEVFTELKQYAVANFPELALGIGSVVDAATAALYIQIDADFIVSPIVSEEMAKMCNRRGVLWIPGCGTLTEMLKGVELGANIVKAFPAGQLGGPSFIKAVKGPCPWLNIMPTGGVSPEEENLRSWFEAGVVCVGMGSKLINKTTWETGNYEALRSKVAQVCSTIVQVR
ncbi:MAG TPA: bifunctional 4-hydroxy-2-oxoglutarate aldolase/2-dehydro-3-deoxy-phosphogluconate aldolase [Microscillaceae bacterium]|nr:bifunctional 4-hydroxy-2-oxoglutarate aldolase/2-dehydro-3-deoxy-phosphogluconate aldolase [Microscillaceae bacterium]